MIQASHPWISPLIWKVYSPLLSHGAVLSPILHGQAILIQLCVFALPSYPAVSRVSPLDRSKAQEIEFPFPSFSSSVEAGGDSQNHIQRCLRESYLLFFPLCGFLNVSLQTFWNYLFYHYSLQYLLNLVIMIVLQFWSIGRHKLLATQFQPQNFICESFFFFPDNVS